MPSKKVILYFILGIIALTIPLALLIRSRIDAQHPIWSSTLVKVPAAPTPSVPSPSQNAHSTPTTVPNPDIDSLPPPQHVNVVKVTQSACTASGGTWNACASACRTAAPGSTCIQVCVSACECRSSKQCPSGTVCTQFVKGVGVCR